MTTYSYEARPACGRLPKHKWLNAGPGVLDAGGLKVGMCPCRVPPETLESLLNEGIMHYALDGREPHPVSIYNILDGVPYRAVRTNAGLSYHGFPCVSARRDVPPRVMKQLLRRAEADGCLPKVKRWFGDNP